MGVVNHMLWWGVVHALSALEGWKDETNKCLRRKEVYQESMMSPSSASLCDPKDF